jgi:membrane-associated phospholipid phosphatase
MIGVISYPTWNIDKFTLWVFLMFSAGWTAWILARYPQMPSLSGYVFNISLKIGAFLAIMLMVKPRKKQRIQHSPISITE